MYRPNCEDTFRQIKKSKPRKTLFLSRCGTSDNYPHSKNNSKIRAINTRQSKKIYSARYENTPINEQTIDGCYFSTIAIFYR